MKFKMHVIITDAIAFARGDYFGSLSLYNTTMTIEGWIDCGEIEFEIDVDSKRVLDMANGELDEKIENAYALAETYKVTKAELLALPHLVE